MWQPVAKLYRDSYAGLSREIWLLSLVMFINRSGTMVLAFMTLYCRHLGFSTAEAGWVVSVYGLGSIAGAYLGGKLSDRIGFYPVQFAALFLGGVCFILLGQMESYTNILIMTFLLSMVNESFRPANATAITQYSTAQNRTQAFSLVRLAINLGWGVGSAIGGILASLDYHWLFMADGVTSMFASFLLLFLLPRPKRLGREEHDGAMQDVITQKAYHDKVFMRFLGLQVLFALCFFQLFTTVPMYLKEGLRLTEYNIGVLMALNGLMIALMEMVLVFRLEGRYPYLRLMAFGTGMMAVSYFLLNLTLIPSFILALLFIIIITIAEMIAMPFMNTYYISRSSQQNRGEYAGLYTMAWSLAQVIGSGSGAWLALLLGFKGLWIFITAICAITAFGYLKLEGWKK